MHNHAFLKGPSKAAVTLIGAKIEKDLVEKHLEQLRRSKRYLVDCKDGYITIYELDTDIGELKEIYLDG
ncbi:MAG: hypothetical protein JRF56_05010 [Deltaproteobacteria bacterium]|jgi:protein tyrosine phosphatase|nr:hypothetical protein [Deltaproteobacteria bacterium]